MEDMLGKAITMGGASLGLAQNLMSNIGAGAKKAAAGTVEMAQEKQDTVTAA